MGLDPYEDFLDEEAHAELGESFWRALQGWLERPALSKDSSDLQYYRVMDKIKLRLRAFDAMHDPDSAYERGWAAVICGDLPALVEALPDDASKHLLRTLRDCAWLQKHRYREGTVKSRKKRLDVLRELDERLRKRTPDYDPCAPMEILRSAIHHASPADHERSFG